MNPSHLVRDGQAAEDTGDFVSAIAAFSSLLEHPEPRIAAEARLHLGRVEWKRGRLDDALTLLEDARARSVRLSDAALRAQVENAIGVLCVARGEYAQARAAYAVARELTEDARTRAKILLNLGVIANIQGHLDEAEKSYEQSRALFESEGDDRGVAFALHNLGMVYADREEWDEADEAFLRALSLLESQGNRQMIANVLMNRSEVLYGRGRVDEGVAQCDLALTIYAELGDELGRGETLRWRARGLRLLRRRVEAERDVTASLRIAARVHNKLLEAECARELGLLLSDSGEPEAAHLAYQRAMALFSELGAEREVRTLIELTAETRPGDRRASR